MSVGDPPPPAPHVTLASSDTSSPATRARHHPSKARWYSPSSADSRPPLPSESRHHSTKSWESSHQAHASQYRVQSRLFPDELLQADGLWQIHSLLERRRGGISHRRPASALPDRRSFP